MLDALGAFDPGSNPGRPTIFLEGEVHRQNAVANFADGGANELVHTGFRLGILFSWFSSASIVGESIVSTASASDMLVHGAVFSLAFGYVNNFLTMLVNHIESWESEDD